MTMEYENQDLHTRRALYWVGNYGAVTMTQREGLRFFRLRRPSRCQSLKVLESGMCFPPPVGFQKT